MAVPTESCAAYLVSIHCYAGGDEIRPTECRSDSANHRPNSSQLQLLTYGRPHTTIKFELKIPNRLDLGS